MAFDRDKMHISDIGCHCHRYAVGLIGTTHCEGPLAG